MTFFYDLTFVTLMPFIAKKLNEELFHLKFKLGAMYKIDIT